MCAIELIICHETNLIASKTYKENKYANTDNLKSEIIKDCTVSRCVIQSSFDIYARRDSLI